MRWEEHCMKRMVLIGCALLLAMTASASARLGIAPLTAQDDAVIQVKGGNGHGHRGGRGRHLGWGRGRGHHKGWRIIATDQANSPGAAFIDPLPG
jgi:hypothetical protein